LEDKIAKVADWIIAVDKVVIFTGAGVSTESGIPDFRSPGGLWDRYDPNDFLYQKIISSEETRKKYWEMHEELYWTIIKSDPNPAHYACIELDKMGKLDCLITQNIDNLHQKAGLSENKIIELHGNTMKVSCLSCGKQYSREEIQEWLENGIEVPYCEECKGILKPTTIAFGQAMPQRETEEAKRRSRNCDLFIAMGSSLVVHPAALMPLYAKEGGARLVIINLTPTPYDGQADLLVPGKAGEVISRIVRRVREQTTN
jgi:NAD-dependent deacetylase